MPNQMISFAGTHFRPYKSRPDSSDQMIMIESRVKIFASRKITCGLCVMMSSQYECHRNISRPHSPSARNCCHSESEARENFLIRKFKQAEHSYRIHLFAMPWMMMFFIYTYKIIRLQYVYSFHVHFSAAFQQQQASSISVLALL